MDRYSRRSFLGSTAGAAMGMAALGGVTGVALAAAGQAAAEDQANTEKKEKGMRVGMLTAPYRGESLETVADFAKSAGIAAMEVFAAPGSKLIDPAAFDAGQAEAIKKMLSERGVEISSLAYYPDMADPKKQAETAAHFKKTVDAAVMLGVPVVCTLAGWPVDGMSKIETIKKVLPKTFAPLIAYAKDKGIKIALENYFETNLQGIDTFECLFENIPDENFGLNYDPSHLYHQQCNHLLPVKMFGKRIFHTHAKDTLVDVEKRANMGVYAHGWWRYVIPGFGNINWGEYISHLRMQGYEGVLSIEHEDDTFSREEGFKHAARYLNQFC